MTGMIGKGGGHWRLLHQLTNQHHYRGSLSASRAMQFSLTRNSSAPESSVSSGNGTNVSRTCVSSKRRRAFAHSGPHNTRDRDGSFVQPRSAMDWHLEDG